MSIHHVCQYVRCRPTFSLCLAYWPPPPDLSSSFPNPMPVLLWTRVTAARRTCDGHQLWVRLVLIL